VTPQSTSGDDQLELEGKHMMFVGDLPQLPPGVSNLRMRILYPLMTRPRYWPSIRKCQLQKPTRAPNPLWIDILSLVSRGQANDVQDWRELQRQFRVTVTEKVDVALSFFCSGPQPKKFFSPDCQ
jgi:hypothetical protein